MRQMKRLACKWVSRAVNRCMSFAVSAALRHKQSSESPVVGITSRSKRNASKMATERSAAQGKQQGKQQGMQQGSTR